VQGDRKVRWGARGKDGRKCAPPLYKKGLEGGAFEYPFQNELGTGRVGDGGHRSVGFGGLLAMSVGCIAVLAVVLVLLWRLFARRKAVAGEKSGDEESVEM
jgi:hypothetical protein